MLLKTDYLKQGLSQEFESGVLFTQADDSFFPGIDFFSK